MCLYCSVSSTSQTAHQERTGSCITTRDCGELSGRNLGQVCYLCVKVCYLCVNVCYLCVNVCYLCVNVCYLCVKVYYLCVNVCYLCVKVCYICVKVCYLCVKVDEKRREKAAMEICEKE